MSSHTTWWYASGEVPPAPTPITIVMVGAGQLAQAGGPLITRPGEVVPEMAVNLYHRPNINTLVAQLDNVLTPTFQDRLKEIGTASIELLNDDPDLSHVWDHECALRFEIHGRAAFTALVSEIQHVGIAEGEEHDQRTTISGPGHIAVLRESVVYPPNGPDAQPFSDYRGFFFASPDFDDEHWGDAWLIRRAGDVTEDENYYWHHVLDNFPDPDAWWIWQPGATVTTHQPTDGDCYIRSKFTLTGSPCDVMIYASIDNEGEIFLDGLPMVPDIGYSTTWVDTGQTFLTPGVHTIGVRASNTFDPATGDDPTKNPAGVLITIWKLNTEGEPIECIHRTGQGEWVGVWYPPQAPGMTPGEIIRHVIQEGQARGCFPEVTLGFTDEFDSAGEPWPVTTEVTTQIGSSCWTFIGEELATTYVDVWMAPGDFMLYAWLYGRRGRERPITLTGPTDENDEQTANLRGLTHHTVR